MAAIRVRKKEADRTISIKRNRRVKKRKMTVSRWTTDLTKLRPTTKARKKSKANQKMWHLITRVTIP